MEFIAEQLQKRQKASKQREAFSKFKDLAEEGGNLSRYLTSTSAAKKKRQQFSNAKQKHLHYYGNSVCNTPRARGNSLTSLHVSGTGSISSSMDFTSAFIQNQRASHIRGTVDQLCLKKGTTVDENEAPPGPSHPIKGIGGSFQSPINLTSREAVYDPTLSEQPFKTKYEPTREFELINTGYVLQLSLRPRPVQLAASEANLTDAASRDYQYRNESSKDSIISGGPLQPGCEYQLIDILFHWGNDTDRGSEHTVNFKAYPMEIQLVHWNRTNYSSYDEALGKENGICICALFVQEGRDHPTMKMIIDHIVEIAYKGRTKRMTTVLRPDDFLPDSTLRDYWVYKGSLTIPPCHENVTWILYRYPLTMSAQQLVEFRRLKTFYPGEPTSAGVEGDMVDNFRPTQSLCDRTIRASFKP